MARHHHVLTTNEVRRANVCATKIKLELCTIKLKYKLQYIILYIYTQILYIHIIHFIQDIFRNLLNFIINCIKQKEPILFLTLPYCFCQLLKII